MFSMTFYDLKDIQHQLNSMSYILKLIPKDNR